MWTVPRMWEDGECWIIGGGPSIIQQFGIPADVEKRVREGEDDPSAYSPWLAPIHNKHVIGVNAAFLIGDWIDMMIFGDNKFYLAFHEQLARWKGIKVSCHKKFRSEDYRGCGIKYLAKHRRTIGISPNPSTVCWHSNTGAAAINLAVHTGVKRIILLGYDMKTDGTGNQHWHMLYKGLTSSGKTKRPILMKSPFQRHLLGFPAIAKDARKMGVEIINASPDSAIEVFPKVKVSELL